MSPAHLSLGAAMLAGLAAAAPAAPSWNSWGSNPTAPSGPSSTGISAGNLKSGNPFSFPLPNGFPTLSDAAKQEVNILAQGTEPNGGAPTLTADDLTSFQLIAFNELFEVAFFTDLLYNVTNNVQGFSFQDQAQRQKVISALVAVQAQEELHADNANAVLMANGKDPIQPCQYKFPTTNLNDAFTLAATFTDVVLGTLQDVQLHLAQNNDDGVVPIIGSVIGQEVNSHCLSFETNANKPLRVNKTVSTARSTASSLQPSPSSHEQAENSPSPLSTKPSLFPDPALTPTRSTFPSSYL